MAQPGGAIIVPLERGGRVICPHGCDARFDVVGRFSHALFQYRDLFGTWNRLTENRHRMWLLPCRYRQRDGNRRAEARKSKQMLESGARIGTQDGSGERGFMNDTQRAQEIRKANRVLDSCN